ncbi:hypothetical protein AB0F85_04220 [Nocardia fluminea]|uniref:hypothetical protein n=1 Tax=Nocardia fluminea TaxID=134984 RepID=UPI0033C0EF91
MGRISNRKAQRRSGERQLTQKELHRESLKSNRRARQVGDTLEAFAQVSNHSIERLAETLISRYTIRMENIGILPDRYRIECLATICPVIGLDFTLRRLGVPLRRSPVRYQGGWLIQLSWGMDSAISACRLLLVGQFAGAALIARQQLELWTSLYASAAGIQREKSESVQDFIARVWTDFSDRGLDLFTGAVAEDPDPDDSFGDSETTTEEPQCSHRHIVIDGKEPICPAVVYGYLSEILHAREFTDAVVWESVSRLEERKLPDEAIGPIWMVGDALSLCMMQMRIITAVIAGRSSEPALADLVLSAPVNFSTKDREAEATSHPLESFGYVPVPAPQGAVVPHLHSLMPLTPNEGLRPEVVQTLEMMARAHEAAFIKGKRPAGRLYRDDESVTLIFASHRMSSVLAAQAALESEKRMLGSDFNIDGLTSRATNFVIVTEFAAMCARWSSGNEQLQNSLAMVSTSLRTAFWLWLEDDDRAMAILRCTFEQIARAKVWHNKREKAELLEADPGTMPRDWINAAGWRRLAALNRAFGEFAHAHTNPRWDGARRLLSELQFDRDSESAHFTGRRAALELVSVLVARTCTDLVEAEYSSEIGSVARELFEHACGIDMTPGDASLNRILDHIWQFRSHPLIKTPYPKVNFSEGDGNSIADPLP